MGGKEYYLNIYYTSASGCEESENESKYSPPMRIAGPPAPTATCPKKVHSGCPFVWAAGPRFQGHPRRLLLGLRAPQEVSHASSSRAAASRLRCPPRGPLYPNPPRRYCLKNKYFLAKLATTSFILMIKPQKGKI